MSENPAQQPHVLWSRPAEERTGTPLLVMMHGYGADERDLMGIVPELPGHFSVASVRAPFPMGPGFTWFPLMDDPTYSLDTVKRSVDGVLDWIDGVRQEHSSVSLLGFSMGMAMATSALRTRPTDFAAVVGLSGFVVESHGDPYFRDDDVRSNLTPLFWGRDQADPIIPGDRIEYSSEWLREHTKLTKVIYTGIGHGISVQELKHVGEFLSVTVG